MGDVGSFCESEFDCKPRNFCWKLDMEEHTRKVCIEKHVAPDEAEFFWDHEMYP